uniref:Uncharacterized protein n=1 Tax=Parascaris univalens TaxID=6257 RepID=A0A915A3M9_PARUN
MVELLAFAHEANLSQLKQMCISIIVGEHYQRFKQYYNDESPDAAHRSLYERIRRSGFLMTISPLSRIESLWRQSRKCRQIYRFGVKSSTTLAQSPPEHGSNAIWNEVD